MCIRKRKEILVWVNVWFMFSDKESAIELYNALEGTNYGMDTEVEFTTLEVKGMLFENITIEEFAEIRAEEKWEEGRKEGLKEGQKRLSSLIQRLIAENRMDEVKLVVEDENVQNRLLEEYGL